MRLLRVLGGLYILLIAHVSLLPWTGWRVPPGNVLCFVTQPIMHGVSRSGVLVNVLAYIPLGLLLVASDKRGGTRAVLLATVAGGALSFSMEALQWYVPGRDAAMIDVITNTTGAFLGAVAAASFRRVAGVQRLVKRVTEGVHSQPVALAGLSALALWALAELSPFVPVLHALELRTNLMPVWQLFQGTYTFQPFAFLTYALYMAGAMLLWQSLRKKETPDAWPLLAAAACVLLVQPLVHRRQLSFEALGGVAMGAVIYRVVRPRECTRSAILLLLAGFIAYELEPKAGSYALFNWVPFSEQNEVRVSSFGNILATTWPFLAVGCLAVMTSPQHTTRRRGVVGGFAVFIIVFGLEWAQLRISGRCGDITPAILAVAGWSVPWFLPRRGDQTGAF